MTLKSKEVQRQYPNLLERFLDFDKFEGLDVEQKVTNFCDFVKSKTSEEIGNIMDKLIPT
jgi:phage terminase Nu1 subunit (DNA packaging protein)